MLSIFQKVSDWYVANATYLWGSMDHYFHMALIPILLLTALYYVQSFSQKKKNYSAVSKINDLLGILQMISYGLLLIIAAKYLIAFVPCIISFVVRLF